MADEQSRVPRVFISYSHDSPDHANRVLEFADRLRRDGIDSRIDQYVKHPDEGWPRWMVGQIQDADIILVVGTETYGKRVDGLEESGKGRGVRWEGNLLYQTIYEADSKQSKIIPVVFEDADAMHIPLPLRGFTHYNVLNESSYLELRLRIDPRLPRRDAMAATEVTIPLPQPLPVESRQLEPVEGVDPVFDRLSYDLKKLKWFSGLGIVFFFAAILAFWIANHLKAGDFGFFLALIPAAASAALCLFGILKSSATYRGEAFGGRVELGGPAVIFAIVLLSGIKLLGKSEAFPFTVYLRAPNGEPASLEQGTLYLELGRDPRPAMVGPRGEAHFPSIAPEFRGEEVVASLKHKEFTLPPKSIVTLTESSADLTVELRTRKVTLSGSVNRKSQPVAGAEIRIGDENTRSDERGKFRLEIELIGSADGGSVEVWVDGIREWNEDVHLPLSPSPLEISLP